MFGLRASEVVVTSVAPVPLSRLLAVAEVTSVAAASQSRRLSDTTTVAVEFYISGTDVDAAREAIDDLVNGNEEDVTALTNVLNSALSEEFGQTIEIADAQLRDPSVSVVAVLTA